MSTIFDIGGVFGGISTGVISDIIEARGVTTITFISLSIPTLILYLLYGSILTLLNVVLMFSYGFLVNRSYSLITTAVVADLGTQGWIKGSSRAFNYCFSNHRRYGLCRGCAGSLPGYVSTRGWNNVFSMLIVSISFARGLFIHVVKNEIKGKMNEGKWPSLT